MDYWRAILKRIVAVIKFLGQRGLPFRGDDDTCGSIHNGNYLGILDLLSEFDPMIASHIARYGNKGKGILDNNRNVSKVFLRLQFLIYRSCIVSLAYNLR